MQPGTNPFTSHPRAVGESYLRHAVAALRYAGLLGLAGGAAAVHAVFPFLFQRSASSIVHALHAEMSGRKARGGAVMSSEPERE